MGKVDDALFEARPYVEYWDRLKELVEKLWDEVESEEEFIKRIMEEMEKAEEPFKTDLRIFLQKFEVL
ncbi:hypothetical protein [Thermococcus pacificus]|uniref:Uncharacterized protein n=1 Tax=Thermococcus pacificus TaxID=71998 RepID=A0A218P7G0_9EURY|nr:hypothetical protein [Thermococcus pacificus]ASJ06714.1 hypothetical protein A3L08_04970 [Thermococcus pacificus]